MHSTVKQIFMRQNSYEFRHYNHAVGLAIVHLVWIPKRRKKVLVGEVRDRIFQIFAELALEKDWKIRALEVAWKPIPTRKRGVGVCHVCIRYATVDRIAWWYPLTTTQQ